MTSKKVDDSAKANQTQLDWLKNVYQGDKIPQLTLRAVLMGGILGSLMSVSNLYTTIKLGWGFGVSITACILSFVIWNAIRLLFPKASPMSILENNCMQSTASAAGYSTGSTIGTAIGAYLLITGKHLDWPIVLAWTFLTAALGVFLAIPMKRQMINQEQLAFPTGIASAQTLRSLYNKSKDAVRQAHALVVTLFTGAIVGILSKGKFAWQLALGLKIPEFISFRGQNVPQFPGFGIEPSLLLISAGMIVGMRVCLSMFIGASLLYFVVGPALMDNHLLEDPSKLIRWSLWTGTALMVTSGLTAFALQWKTVVRAISSLKKTDKTEAGSEEMDSLEVPFKWFLIGVIPLTCAMALLEYVAFSISLPLGILSVILSFLLALVACRSTGETDITPIGAMGKITQLVYAALVPSNITTNLMTASATANTAIGAADLLTDLKSGYLLGANPRKQLLAQFTGVFFGTLAIVPAWYLMIPDKAHLEALNPPSTLMWKAVAEALSYGIDFVPVSARYGILIGGILGIVLAAVDHFFPRIRKYVPSAMGLGLSWVFPFNNSLAFFIGALIAFIWSKINAKNSEKFMIPIASGAIAGESLACATVAIIDAAAALIP